MNDTIFLDFVNGIAERVYPCRCGETHRGAYAVYDWAHHNCFHDAVLLQIASEIPDYFMCPDCGKHFYVDLSAR